MSQHLTTCCSMSQHVTKVKINTSDCLTSVIEIRGTCTLKVKLEVIYYSKMFMLP